MRNRGLKSLGGLIGALVFASAASGYAYLTTDTAPYPTILQFPGPVSMQLMVDNATVLSDGETRASTIQTAMLAWNGQINTVQFTSTINAVGSGGNHNGTSEIFFASSPYGSGWGSDTLAITISWYFTGSNNGVPVAHATETDVLVNSNYSWDSYRGALHPGVYELQRVMLHELGHCLGLDHPNQHGQSVVAVMNSSISNVDVLQPDDIAGGQSLYGTHSAGAFITRNPRNQTTYAGQTAQFTADASGSPAPTFRWQRLPAGGGSWADLTDGGSFTGSGTTTLAVVPDVSMNGDQFRCVATNSSSATSTAATLTVIASAPPTITIQPGNASVTAPNSATFTVGASGTPTPTVLWQILPAGSGVWANVSNGGAYSGATSTSVTVVTAVGMNGDQFRAAASNSNGTTLSNAATLSVSAAPPPVITLQPQSDTIAEGADEHFRVLTSDSGITYTWQVAVAGSSNWTNLIADANYHNVSSNQLDVVAAPYAFNGNSYRCLLTNAGGGSVYTVTVVLQVIPEIGVTTVASGGSFGLFIRADGSLGVVGANGNGQLGSGSTTDISSPVTTSGSVVAVTGGAYHTLVIHADGALWGMGSDNQGELGDGASTPIRQVPISIAAGVITAAAGVETSYYVKTDGSLWALGLNNHYQLGDGTNTNRSSPVFVASDVVAVSAGSDHVLFLRGDGTVWGVGSNYTGQLGLGTTDPITTPTLIATNVAAIAAGAQHSVLLKTDGTVWTFGKNLGGQLGDGTTNWHNTPVQVATGARAIAAGGDRTFFIKTDGTLWGTGSSYLGNGSPAGSLSPVLVASNVSAVATGTDQTYFAQNDGTLWSFGLNDYGQLGTGNHTAQASPYRFAHGIMPSLGAPTNLAASASAIAPGVRVTWKPPLVASRYEVWRSAVNDFATATRLNSEITVPVYYDLTSLSGTSYYWIKAINFGATTLSSVLLFNPVVAPVIVTQPTNQTVGAGYPATFTVAATGGPAPTLQWQILPAAGGSWTNLNNGGGYAGATTATLTVTTDPAMNGDQFRCVATNASGSATSNAASLAVITTPPYFSYQSGGREASPGGSPTFTVTAVGIPTPTLQWQRYPAGGSSWANLSNGASYAGVTTTTLTVSNLNLGMNGDYFRCVASNVGGSAASLAAMLTVGPLVTGDFNFDRQKDLIWEDTATGERALWLMHGTVYIGGVSFGVIDPAWRIVGAADFNGDGKTDILWENTSTGDRNVWLMDGVNHVSTVDMGIVSPVWRMAALADFNGDQQTDIMLENTSTGERVVWLMNGTNVSSTISYGTISTAWRIAASADFNHDGQIDIVWENTQTGQHAIWLMNGTIFQSAIDFGSIPTQWRLATVGDFDGDGDVDFFWENTVTGDRALWLMHGTIFSSSIYFGIIPTDWNITP